MNRNWIRYSVIAVVFFASLLIFSVVLNQGNTDMTMEMAPACLPTASILMEDQKVNEMHGYDDEPETVKHRLEVYHQETEPLKEFYAKRGLLKSVETQPTVAATTEALMQVLR